MGTGTGFLEGHNICTLTLTPHEPLTQPLRVTLTPALHYIWCQKSPLAKSTATVSAFPSLQKIAATGVHILSIGMCAGPQ